MNILERIDQALSGTAEPKPEPTTRERIKGALGFVPEGATLSWAVLPLLAEEAGGLPKSTAKELRKLDAEYGRIEADVVEALSKSAEYLRDQHVQRMSGALLEGRSLREFDGWATRDFEVERVARAEAGKTAQREIRRRAHALVQPFITQCIEAGLGLLVTERDAGEHRRRRYGLAAEVDPVAVAIARALVFLDDLRSSASAGSRPADFVGMFGDPEATK